MTSLGKCEATGDPVIQTSGLFGAWPRKSRQEFKWAAKDRNELTGATWFSRELFLPPMEFILRRRAVNEWLFTDAVYADDLNAYRIFSSHVKNDSITTCARLGRGHPSKQTKHILSFEDLRGGAFWLLRIVCDVKLTMSDAIAEVVMVANWKMQTILPTQHFYSDAELIGLYKAHPVSYLAYRTVAVYLAQRDVLEKLYRVQIRFLRDCGVDEKTAPFSFNLAHLAVRRDIAMLCLIH